MSELAPTLDPQALAELLRRDPPAALATALGAARAGRADAQLLLAQMYMDGIGTAADAASGLHWYQIAASQGSALAMNMVGRCHELGRGGAADPARAAVWYRKAAEHGLDWRLYNYANLLATGRGVAQDRAQALALYARAAQLGHAKSMNLLGRHLEDGLETDKDPRQALHWYRRSAEAGDFRGQASYASVLLQRGQIASALPWLRRAAAARQSRLPGALRPRVARIPARPGAPAAAGLGSTAPGRRRDRRRLSAAIAPGRALIAGGSAARPLQGVSHGHADSRRRRLAAGLRTARPGAFIARTVGLFRRCGGGRADRGLEPGRLRPVAVAGPRAGRHAQRAYAADAAGPATGASGLTCSPCCAPSSKWP